MIKEYIDNLLLETNEELEILQKQMSELLDELKSSQEQQEKLQREKNKDTNIFSPRSMQLDTDEKLVQAREEVKKNNQQVEYIRERIENSLKKKQQFETLLVEINEMNVQKNKNLAEDHLNDNYLAENHLTEADPNDDQKKYQTDIQNMKNFLQKIYKSTELCLACMNSDKNRCRNELRAMKSDIKKFASDMGFVE